MSWNVIFENLHVVEAGLLLTLKLTILGIIGSFGLGVLVGALQAYSRFWGKQLADLYIEIMRNVPLVVKLFFLYFVIGLDAFPAALIALVVHQSGFIADVTASGLRSIPREQLEAGSTTGLSRTRVFLHILFPQALRVTIPAYTNQFIELEKNTALISLIGLQDLTFVAQNIQIETYRYLESFIVVTVLYVGIAFFIAGLMSALQARLVLR